MATYVNSVPEQRAASNREAQLPWKQLLWFGGLLFLCYAPVLYRLVLHWMSDEDMGHGFFVPVVAGYIVWQRRSVLSTIKPQPNYWGILFLVWGAIQMLLGTLGAELFLARTSFLISLVGIILLVGGSAVLRAVAFPLCLLPFMIPIPAIIYARITLPLQLFASAVAENLLGLLGIPVLRDGNVLELASQKLSVVEACSGIRSLLSLSFLSLIYAYFFDAKVWMRWVLLLSTIPIAIAANATRVTMTGLLSEIRTDLAQGFFHTLEGWVLFLVAMALLVLFHKFVNFIYGIVQQRKQAHA
ncbi:MAG: exosortase/archaeosortase family protein [Acidobacteriaceae bacterium]|nr:exosortase/archaeosortase family protein [Acidobacteriaceae bacterium]